MSWEILPLEIRSYILNIRNQFRNEAANKIQNIFWNKYILPDLIAIDLALDIQIDQFHQVMVSIPSTEKILKKCLFVTSGKRYLLTWKKILEKIKTSLFFNEYMPEQWLTYEAICYRRTCSIYIDLLKKFNIEE